MSLSAPNRIDLDQLVKKGDVYPAAGSKRGVEMLSSGREDLETSNRKSWWHNPL